MVSDPSENRESDEGGTFEQVSLALLMIRALDRRWTGTLKLQLAGGDVETLEFQRGLVCRALVPDAYARLGELLLAAKVVTAEELDEALSRGGLLGAALNEQKVIDDTTLQRALVLQLLRRTSRMFGRPPDTRWSFTTSLVAFDGMPEGVRIDTLRLLWAGLSVHGEMGNWLALTLKRIGESPFQVRQDVNLRRFGFTADARQVVRKVRDERLTLPRLLELGIAPEDVVRQIIYLLAITRYLDFSPVEQVDSAPPISSSSGAASIGDEPSISDETTVDETSAAESPISSDGQAAPAPPRRVARIKLRRVAVRPAAPDPPGSGEHRSPQKSSGEVVAGPPSSDSTLEALPDGALDQLRAEVTSRLSRLSQETPFSLLDLKPVDLEGKEDSELTEIFWDAYERCSKKWHPDNCPSEVNESELNELVEGMTRIYDAMTQAFVELTESQSRHALVAAFLGAAEGEPATVRSRDSGADEDGDADPDTAPPSSGERRVETIEVLPADLHAKALAALSEQELDEALRLCKAASEAQPDNADFLATLVWIQASADRPDTKVLLLDLDGILRGHPDHAQARFYRGVLRRRLGSDNAAKRDFERVLELQPGHSGAKAQLGALSNQKKRARK